MIVEIEELQYWDWIAKITEKLMFMRLKVQDRKDISEDDWELLRVLYPLHYNGEYPLYVTKMEGTSQSVIQTNLFDAKSTGNLGGILLELDEETKIEEK
jgi:hypothetical protein